MAQSKKIILELDSTTGYHSVEVYSTREVDKMYRKLQRMGFFKNAKSLIKDLKSVGDTKEYHWLQRNLEQARQNNKEAQLSLAKYFHKGFTRSGNKIFSTVIEQ